MTAFQMASFPGAPLVGIGVELAEVVWFPAEVSEITVEDAAEVAEADAVEDLSPVTVESAAVVVTVAVAVAVVEVEVEVAATRTPAEVVSLTPQIASASKVNAMSLALHSLLCRVIESKFMACY